jgi:predicted Zn-dependent protease
VKEAEIRCDTTTNTISIYPTVCYQFFTNGKHPDEAVRDIVISGTPQQWLTNLAAGGEKIGSVSIFCHHQHDDVITHCCSPALLFRQAEVSHRTPVIQKQIVRQITAPSADNQTKPSELFFQAAQNEWNIDRKELSVGEDNQPYYQDFTMTDARIFTVEASEGNICYSHEKAVRTLVPTVLLGSDRLNNEKTGTSEVPEIYPISLDNNLQAFVRDFRKATETEYLKSAKQWESKKFQTEQFDAHRLNNRSKTDVNQSYNDVDLDYPTLNNLEHLARETSALLAKYDFLTRSGVNIYIMMGNTYFWNSEKTAYSRPISVIGMQIYGVIEKNGIDYMDGKTLFLPCTDSLFSTQHTQNEIYKLALHLQNLKENGTEEGRFYSGPILLEDEAVGQMLAAAMLETTPNLLTYRDLSSSLKEKQGQKGNHFENQLDQIITAKQISVTANKSGDIFDKSTFVIHEKTDAEGVETQETEIIRNGELITLMGNRSVTKATPYSNGFQQLAIHNEGCFGTKGVSRIDFEHKTKMQHAKLKQLLIKEAKKQGCKYAYILRQVRDNTMQNLPDNSHNTNLLQLYRVDLTGKEVPVTGIATIRFHFYLLDEIIAVSNQKTAYPVMINVEGAFGSRDFPFAGVPTCIVAPDGILFKSFFIEQ